MKTVTDTKTIFVQHILQLQDTICRELEQEDGSALFKEDLWQRPGGGGGKTRIIENGQVFEKGGVNTSEVSGEVTEMMKKQLSLKGDHFFAAGLSLVLHPLNPFVPAVHANFRYFELYDKDFQRTDCWFGGGLDLTPYYLYEEDVTHFHQVLKNACDEFHPGFYPAFKINCDNYFVNKHRGKETRGVGGIFFDQLRPNEMHTEEFYYQFIKTCSEAFLAAYLPIVQKRKLQSYTELNIYWQEIRRGRYVEFNLIHDKGTLFGLKTNGRIESILMSLPPRVRFDYNYQPVAGSEEDKLLQVCLQPREWC